MTAEGRSPSPQRYARNCSCLCQMRDGVFVVVEPDPNCPVHRETGDESAPASGLSS